MQCIETGIACISPVVWGICLLFHSRLISTNQIMLADNLRAHSCAFACHMFVPDSVGTLMGTNFVRNVYLGSGTSVCQGLTSQNYMSIGPIIGVTLLLYIVT